MNQICQQAADEFRDFVFKQHDGLSSLDRQEVLEYAYNLIVKYGEASGTLACQFYEMIADMQGVTITAAEMAEVAEFGEFAKAFNGAAKMTELNTPGVVQRMVKQVGADTMLKNAKRDGAYFAWIASGGSGGTCSYCLMLSAIGWRKAGKKTLNGDHAEHIHANCDCQYVVDFRGDLKVEGYNPESLQNQIMDAVDPTEDKYFDYDDFLSSNGKSAIKVDRADLRTLQRALNEKKINYQL